MVRPRSVTTSPDPQLSAYSPPFPTGFFRVFKKPGKNLVQFSPTPSMADPLWRSPSVLCQPQQWQSCRHLVLSIRLAHFQHIEHPSSLSPWRRLPRRSLQQQSKSCDSVGLVQGTKPPKAGNTKKLRKKYKIPHPGSGPENTKKLPKKYKNGHFRGIFVFFRKFFRIFGAQSRGGGFCMFFRNFFVFPALGGFCALYEPDGIAK